MFSLPCNHVQGQINLSKQFASPAAMQHMCWVYENQQEHKTVLVDFVTEGFKNHEKVALVIQANMRHQILDYFSEETCIESYLDSGQLVMLTSDEVYFPPNVGFVPEVVTEKFAMFIEQALLEGYTKLRAYGDMTFAAQVNSQELVRYESQLIDLYSSHRSHAVGLCGYPSYIFDSSLIVAMMTCHPKLCIGTEAFDANFYYVPNGVNKPLASVAEHWISNLRERKSLVEELNQKNQELTEINKILKGETEEREKIEMEKKLAEEADRKKRAFIATLSHEIRTPLFGILSTAALLRDTRLSKEQEEYISMVDAIGDHLITVVNDVLDYSKFESCQIELEQKPFSVKECVASVLQMFRNKKDASKMTLDYKLSKQVPATVTGDVTRLRQILLNLVGNAIKFTKNQGKISVKVDCTKVGGKLKMLFSVQDNGIGIPKEKFGRIFNEYQQAEDSTTRLYGGTGLGLAISKKLVEAMCGSIWFKSEVGVGTTFFFSITLDDADNSCPSNQMKKRRCSFECERQQCCPLQILVVEDNPINQTLLAKMLKKIGYASDLAENGQQAVEMTRKRDYDLILMDFHMPVMNGPQAARNIFAMDWTNKTPPRIVAVTASVFDEEKRECQMSGMDGLVQKPLKIDHLRQVCEETAIRCKRQKIQQRERLL